MLLEIIDAVSCLVSFESCNTPPAPSTRRPVSTWHAATVPTVSPPTQLSKRQGGDVGEKKLCSGKEMKPFTFGDYREGKTYTLWKLNKKKTPRLFNMQQRSGPLAVPAVSVKDETRP